MSHGDLTSSKTQIGERTPRELPSRPTDKIIRHDGPPKLNLISVDLALFSENAQITGIGS